jgi:hypothetical protein
MFKLFNRIGEIVGKSQIKLAKSILKIKPKSSVKINIKKFTWDDFFNHLKIIHIWYAGLGIAGVFTISYKLTDLPILNLSIVGAIELVIQTVVGKFSTDTDITMFSTPLVFILLVLWRNQVGSIYGIGPINLIGGLPWFAMREELLFRAGSENWTFIEKVRGCLSFGLIHITMLLVPLGTAIALSFGGAVLMFVYIRAYNSSGSHKKAVKESATVHTLYNALLLITLFILLVLILIGAI